MTILQFNQVITSEDQGTVVTAWVSEFGQSAEGNKIALSLLNLRVEALMWSWLKSRKRKEKKKKKKTEKELLSLSGALKSFL